MEGAIAEGRFDTGNIPTAADFFNRADIVLGRTVAPTAAATGYQHPEAAPSAQGVVNTFSGSVNLLAAHVPTLAFNGT